MVNWENIRTGTMILNEFQDKIKSLCEEYENKLAGACPENISSLFGDQILFQPRLQINSQHNITENEAKNNGFINAGYPIGEDYVFFKKCVNGVDVICVIPKEVRNEE